MAGKIAYVLAGGGAKGAFQLGVMQALDKQGVKPDLLIGTSVGALNSVGYAWKGIQGATDIWLGIKSRESILSISLWEKMKTLWRTGYYNMEPLRGILKDVISGPPPANAPEAVACFVELYTGAVLYQSSRSKKFTVEKFRQYVEASAAIPLTMELPPNPDGPGILADGGVRERAPLRAAIDAGYETIYCILNNPISVNMLETWKPTFPDIVTTGYRAIDVCQHECYVNDIRLCDQKNNDPTKKKIDLKVFAPDKLLIDTIQFEPGPIRAAIAQGNEAKQVPRERFYDFAKPTWED